MDPPTHTAFRRIVESYLTSERVAGFESTCRDLVCGFIAHLPRTITVEFVAAFAEPLAVRLQCAFTDWGDEDDESLAEWTHRNRGATRAQDRDAMNRVAGEFTRMVVARLRRRHAEGPTETDDVWSRLGQECVEGRPLSEEEVVSILRNWTVGEIGTMAASIGILVGYLARHPDLQAHLRRDPSLIPSANDEILRIYGPLAANRRRTTCPARIGARDLPAGDRIYLNWIAANRDESVFDDPAKFRWDRDPSHNLLYGAGIHVCPGAPLARMELRVAIEEMLANTTSIQPAPDALPEPAAYPACGFATLPLLLT